MHLKKVIFMTKYREILRLHSLGVNVNQKVYHGGCGQKTGPKIGQEVPEYVSI